ncbi:MAG: DUF1778 domain-containing protein [Saprospiraceae bacterium]
MKTGATARFDTRLTKEQKSLFQHAASLKGQTLSEFVISSAHESAKAIIEEHSFLLQSKEDQAIFFEILMNPPEPNENLKRAAQWYKEAFRKG